MRRQFGQLAVLAIWGAGLGLAVLSYNLWAGTCGGCADRTAIPLRLLDYGFLGLIGAALLFLILLKWRRKAALAHCRCACGTILAQDWNYCPACGTSRKT